MKKNLLLILLVLVTATAHSQTIDKTMYDNVYYFLTSASLAPCGGDGTLTKGASPVDIPPLVQFKITKILDNGDYVIHISKAVGPTDVVTDVADFNKRFVKRPGSPTAQVQQAQAQPGAKDSTGTSSAGATKDDGSYIFLYLPVKTFNSSCDVTIKKYSVSVGALTLPIKIRPGQKNSDGTYRDFSFESDISLGLSFGLKIAPNKHTAYNILTGVDLTSVPVTPASTNNSVMTATNLSAITWHLGFLFQIDNFQIGAFTGIDYLAGSTGRQWMYRNDMWLGLGIGYSIFSPKKTTDTQ